MTDQKQDDAANIAATGNQAPASTAAPASQAADAKAPAADAQQSGQKAPTSADNGAAAAADQAAKAPNAAAHGGHENRHAEHDREVEAKREHDAPGTKIGNAEIAARRALEQKALNEHNAAGNDVLQAKQEDEAIKAHTNTAKAAPKDAPHTRHTAAAGGYVENNHNTPKIDKHGNKSWN